MAGKYQLGQFYCEKGFIGKLSYIRGQSSAEIEKRVGYRAGRLSSGWVLLVMLKKPAPDQFSLGGYSQNSNAEVMERSPSGFPVRTRIDTVARAGVWARAMRPRSAWRWRRWRSTAPTTSSR